MKYDNTMNYIVVLSGLVCGSGGMSGGLFAHQGINQAISCHLAFLEGQSIGLAGKMALLAEKGQQIAAEGSCLQQAHQPLPILPSVTETLSSASNFPTTPPLSLASITVTSTATVATSSNTNLTTTPSPPNISTSPTVTTVSQPITASSDVSQNTAISDRPKAKPVSKKEGKNVRKAASGMTGGKLQQQHVTLMAGLQQQYQQKQRQHTYQVHQVHQLQQLNQQLQLQLNQVQVGLFR